MAGKIDRGRVSKYTYPATVPSNKKKKKVRWRGWGEEETKLVVPATRVFLGSDKVCLGWKKN